MSQPDMHATPTSGPQSSPNVELFAKNLENISHMQWTDDGRLLATEHTAGRVVDVTDGGEVGEEQVVASGLQGPASMAQLDDGRILVSETWGGQIVDITPETENVTYASDVPLPYSLNFSERQGETRLYVSYSNTKTSGVMDVTGGGSSQDDYEKVLTGFPTSAGLPGGRPLDDEMTNDWDDVAVLGCESSPWVSSDNRRDWVTVSQTGQILDVTGVRGESYADLVENGHVVAEGLDQIGGIKYNPHDGRIYGVEPKLGTVFAAGAEEYENYNFTPRVVRGLTSPTCLRFGPDGDAMYVCGQGEGVVWKITDF